MMKRSISLALLVAALALLVSCSSKSEEESQNYYIGDQISTAFFDYTPNSATAADSYEGYTPAEGNKLVIVDMTIKNTETYSMPMGLYDFWLDWGSGDEDYSDAMEQFCDGQLPDEYEIPINGTEEGLLIFEVPADKKDFSLGYLEIYEDESTGNAFFTYFTV